MGAIRSMQDAKVDVLKREAVEIITIMIHYNLCSIFFSFTLSRLYALALVYFTAFSKNKNGNDNNKQTRQRKNDTHENQPGKSLYCVYAAKPVELFVDAVWLCVCELFLCRTENFSHSLTRSIHFLKKNSVYFSPLSQYACVRSRPA